MSATAERRKHWGWGSEARQPSLADLEGMAPLVRDWLGFDAQAPEEPVPLERVELEAPRVSPPDALSEICADDAHRGRRTRSGRPIAMSSVASAAATRTRRTSSPGRGTSLRSRRSLRGAATRGLPRSPTAAVPPSAVGSSRGCPASIRGGVDRPRGARSGGRGGRGLARGPDPGGSARPGARRSAPRARPDDALLPAVVRVLDPGRLDRDARRRPLRHQAHPRGRHGGVGARDHARGRVGEPAPPRVRRRAESGPAVDRIRGHPRRDHRGLGPCAAPAGPQRVVRCRVPILQCWSRGGP